MIFIVVYYKGDRVWSLNFVICIFCWNKRLLYLEEYNRI